MEYKGLERSRQLFGIPQRRIAVEDCKCLGAREATRFRSSKLPVLSMMLMAVDGRRNEVLAVAILFFLLTWSTVSCRIYVRAIMLKTWGWDDWTMLAALV